MSCDWNIKCVDCNDEHRFDDANHQDGLMRFLIKHADTIAALADLVCDQENGRFDVALKTYYGEVDALWFRKHLGHNLMPVDEYGRVDGQCHDWVECSFGHNHKCVLERGHDGPHTGKA